ncbi:MAG TPA: hypothetical protein VG368_00365 [Acidimicrobiales bacterium]|nr:hypothetical protein [Acidimicrobiales bacterium]
MTTTTLSPAPSPTAGRPSLPATIATARATFPGTIAFPDAIASTFSVSSVGGRVRAVLTSEGADVLDLTVACRGKSTGAEGAHRIVSSLTAPVGECRITVRDTEATTGTAFGFALSVTYRVTTPPS